ncbi:MAG TPA: FtsX-like permease family protein [Acidimicrobiales bacterium]
MRQVALRGLRAHTGRLVATVLAVALGVAFIGGVLTLNDTMRRTFDDLLADAYEGTDAVVRSTRTMDGPFGEERAHVDEAVVDLVRGVDGVDAVEGSVEGFARVIGPDGDPVGNPELGAPTLGGNWPEQAHEANPFVLRSGRAPERAGEMVMDAATADTTGYEPGDTVPIQTADGEVHELELVGVVGFGTADSPGGASYVLLTTDEAQELLAEPGRFDTVVVVADDGVDEEQLVARLRAALAGADAAGAPGEGLEVLSGTAITEESQSDLQAELAFVTGFFLTFGVVAVIVGSFVIYNSFSIIVAQRTREMALLRAIGASRRQVRRAVLVEAVVVGLVGSVAGFLLGLGLASALAGFVGVDGGLAIRPTAVAIAVLTGLVVTVASAVLPARRVAKVPPLAALRAVAVDTTGRSRLRFAAGLALLAGGVAAVVAGGRGGAPGTVGLGVALTFVGLLLAGPGLARPVGVALGWPLARLRGVPGSLARENAARNPRRSASTAHALMIGVGIVAFFLVVNASLRASIDRLLDESFAGDLIVDSGSFGMVGLPPRVGEEIRALPEVDAAAPMRTGTAEVAGESQLLLATTPEAFPLQGLDIVEGRADLGPGEVVVLRSYAADEGLAPGDPVRVDFLDTGSATLTVTGVYDGPPGTTIGDLVMGADELRRHVPDATDALVLVDLADGVSVAEARPAIDAIVDPLVGAEVMTVDDYKDAIGGQLDGLLRLLLGMVLLAVVIALLGIANTMALSVLERTRELGLLRAVGMSRRQLRATIRWESVIIALFGTALGLGAGVLAGWGLVAGLGDEGFDVFQVPGPRLAALVIVAGLLGMAAALVPAWRAARLDVLRAIQAE